MGTGIISVIPKDFSGPHKTQEQSLRERGLSMGPGCHKYIFPFKERSGKFRTGLDPDAGYLDNIEDSATRESEKKRIAALKQELENKTKLDLSSTSEYYEKHSAVKLKDGDNIFDLSDIDQAITFAWVSVYPSIASSFEAWQQGKYPADTHFYVKNTDIETKIQYNKVKKLNEAIGKVNSYDLEKRKKIARLVGLPITDDSKEEIVYTELDRFLKKPTVEIKPYMGQDPLTVFAYFSDADDEVLRIKDLVQQALSHQIYREGKAGRILEGESIVFSDKDVMLNHFLDPKQQLDLIDLEKKLKLKKSAK